MPVYNEGKYVRYSLESLLRQTVKPELIAVGDNQSTDNSAGVAREVLARGGDVRGLVVTVKRYPELGKLNVNHVYYSLNRTLDHEFGLRSFDYVATIEADTVLEAGYFEKVAKAFERDPRLCVTAGRLEPLGILEDSFPLGLGGIIPWGSNRVYRAECWAELNELIDIRYLPAWDTDHAVLALLLGYRVYYTPVARAYHLKPVTAFRGFYKGVADAVHGLPAWWAVFKAAQRGDMSYLRGYLTTLTRVNRYRGNGLLNQLRLVYRAASVRAFISNLRKHLGLRVWLH